MRLLSLTIPVCVLSLGAFALWSSQGNATAAANLPPVCDIGGPYLAKCQGGTTVVQLDASGSFDPEGQPLTFRWFTDGPVAQFSNTASATPLLLINTGARCPTKFNVAVVVSDGVSTSQCSAIVTAKPDTNCCELDGDLRYLEMVYTGEACDADDNSQDPGKVTCTGDPMGEPRVHIIASAENDPNKIWFQGTVNINSKFLLDSENAGENKLENETRIQIYDLGGNLLQEVIFHTSCSQPVRRGDHFGGVALVGCTPGGPTAVSCCEGDNKPASFTLTYTGEDCSASTNSQGSAAECTGDPQFASPVRIVASDDKASKVWFDGIVNLNENFDISAANGGETKFESNTYVRIYDMNGVLLQDVKFHTSCSKPLFIGDQYGSIVVVDCEPEGGPAVDLCDRGKPRALQFVYVGGGCGKTNHSQDPGKVQCAGNAGLESPVRIIARSKDKVVFDGMVNRNNLFTIDAKLAGETKLESETTLEIYDVNGNPLQEVTFHTSCSQPLVQRDRFGSVILTGIKYE